ncbi:MAG: c-type cytochrome, partial [Candidatus Hydrogenedentes bacterium]|nr:c-type cytochrome [Candidatus Hydrogenedentota bacterium]
EGGNGGGKAMAYLFPWPRDFRKGVFKHRSTPSGSLPVDQDIYRTIVRGIPGTAMPAWESALTEDETWGVVEYIKGFSQRFDTEKPKAPIQPGTPFPTTPKALERGQQIYREMRCARCHGTDLKGGGFNADNLYDIWDHRVFVYDLTNPNTVKFGASKKDIFTTLTTGIWAATRSGSTTHSAKSINRPCRRRDIIDSQLAPTKGKRIERVKTLSSCSL